MICPDCEQEVEKLNKAGICKQCATRINQNAYLNRKEGTNNPYIPLKDLKNINLSAYNKVMGRRKHKKEVKQTNTKISDKTEKTSDLRNIYYTKVAKDINQAFEDNKISQDYLQYKSLDNWLETLYLLCLDENFITSAKQGESQFNKLACLYKHAQENLSWDDLTKINDISYAQKALSELRRPTKEILDYYEVLDPLVEYLKGNTLFMKLLNEARVKMIQKSNNHENPGYYTDIESDVVQGDFILGFRDSKTKIYDCTVWCYNLNGNPNRRLFRANNGFYAKNEIDARLRFKAFLADKFATVTYKDKDITITEVNSIDDIKKQIQEGL